MELTAINELTYATAAVIQETLSLTPYKRRIKSTSVNHRGKKRILSRIGKVKKDISLLKES